jgi:DNA polymerase-3 subunit gamma/tau
VQSGHHITLQSVQAMMGTVDVSWSQHVFTAIVQNKADALQALFEKLAAQHPNLEQVLDDLLTLCHQVALAQVLPNAAKLDE